MTLITSSKDLKDICARLRTSEYLTVDTEFMRDATFWPVLCLIQVASDDFDCAIDPLAPDMDLEPFFELMRDESILKVFHSARQDIEIFVHRMGDVPRPLFDTQVAAMVCGFGESAGYETLVNKLAGAKIDKAVRFADWSKRPLTERQVAYALSDVTHLRVVYEKLYRLLQKNNRESWLDEEMAVLTDPATYRLHPEDAWRRLKPRTRNRRFLALVQAVAFWREEMAQRRDVPRNRIVRDDVLMEIAAHPPRNEQDLMNLRGFSRGYAKGAEGERLLEVIRAAQALPEDKLPVAEDHGDKRTQATPANDLIRVLLRLKCNEHGVAPKLVASAQDIEAIADAGSDAAIAALRGWRYEIFGRDALALREGRIGLAVNGDRLSLFDIDDTGNATVRRATRERSGRRGRRSSPVPPAGG